MKTITKAVLFLSLTLSNPTIFSQESPSMLVQENAFSIGPRVGVGESIIHLKDQPGEKTKTAFTTGIATTYQFNRILGISTDLMFNSKGGRASGSVVTDGFFGRNTYFYEDEYKIYTAEIPIALKVNVPVGDHAAIKVFAGPNLQFQLSGSNETRIYSDADFQESNGYSERKLTGLNTLENAFQYGLGLELNPHDSQTVFFDIRANESISSLGTINGRKATSSYYMISLGYLF
jgi:hypothetical protein